MSVSLLHADHRAPHPFPTRRSSDLARDGHVVTMISSGEIARRYDVAGFKVIQLPVRYDNTMAVPARISAFLLFMARARSEEHTSELQSPCNLVCRLLLEKKKEV